MRRLKIILGCLVSLLVLASSVPAADAPQPAAPAPANPQDQPQQSQEQRFQDMERRIQELESSARSGKDSADPESKAFPGSWPMYGTDLRIKLGGYVKTDFLYDIDGTTDKNQFLMSTIPVNGTPEHANGGYAAFFSKETRFNMDVRRVTPGVVPLSAFIEGDFWTTGSSQFRLRHAYMNVGDLTIGQTWTTLSFVETLPFMIDFAAGDALFGGRTSLIRYKMKLSDRWHMAVALESFDFLGIENPNGFGGKATTTFPLLAVSADYKWDTGHLWMGSSLAQLRWDGGATGPTDNAPQIDAVVAGKQYLGTDNYFTFNISGGKGSGENIMAFAGSEANAVLNASGKLDTMPAFAAVVGFWHRWSQELSSNFCYAYGWLDTPDSRAPLALKAGGIQHMNLIWQPWKQFSTGIEYMWGTVRAQNHEMGRASRIQTMAKFAF